MVKLNFALEVAKNDIFSYENSFGIFFLDVFLKGEILFDFIIVIIYYMRSDFISKGGYPAQIVFSNIGLGPVLVLLCPYGSNLVAKVVTLSISLSISQPFPFF